MKRPGLVGVGQIPDILGCQISGMEERGRLWIWSGFRVQRILEPGWGLRAEDHAFALSPHLPDLKMLVHRVHGKILISNHEEIQIKITLMYRIVESPRWTPGQNIILYVNYTSIKNKLI